jgi:hypothetical protein
MRAKYAVLLAIGGVALGAAGSSMMTSVLAQNNTPYFQVAAINVIDKEGYEASGVDKVRDSFKANGGKLVGGGYNKAVAIDSDVPASNRFLIWMFPNKAASDKTWEETKSWAEKVKGAKYVDRFRVFGVEGNPQ